MFRLEPCGPLPDGRLAEHLTVPELLPGQIDLQAAREPIPHVILDPVAVPKHPRCQHFPTEDVVQQQRCDVALAERGVVRRNQPSPPSEMVSGPQLALIAASMSASVCTEPTLSTATFGSAGHC